MTRLRAESVSGVPLVCERCGTAITKPNEQQAREAVESHNEGRHSGEQVAVVVTDEYDADTSKANNRDRFAKQLMELVR